MQEHFLFFVYSLDSKNAFDLSILFFVFHFGLDLKPAAHESNLLS
jgi:hypothetical protein